MVRRPLFLRPGFKMPSRPYYVMDILSPRGRGRSYLMYNSHLESDLISGVLHGRPSLTPDIPQPVLTPSYRYRSMKRLRRRPSSIYMDHGAVVDLVRSFLMRANTLYNYRDRSPSLDPIVLMDVLQQAKRAGVTKFDIDAIMASIPDGVAKTGLMNIIYKVYNSY